MASEPTIQVSKTFFREDADWLERERVAGDRPFPTIAKLFSCMRAAYEEVGPTYAEALYNKRFAGRWQPASSEGAEAETECTTGTSVPSAGSSDR